MPIEIVSASILIAGASLLGIAGLWLAIQAFRTGFWWGVGLLLFSLLVPVLAFFSLAVSPYALVPLVLMVAMATMYIPAHWERSRGPVALGIFGLVVIAGALVVGRFSVTRDPRIVIEAGEKHITLTASKGDEIELLKQHPDVVELYLAANPNITNETLEHLESLKELRLLDLDDTAVTDEGLPSLAKLPKLKVLRLSRTKVTDVGFTTHLADLPGLAEVSLRGTQVATPTLRKWKNAGKALNLERSYIPAK